eukprot:458088-Ditylum_brightwellii.AAC.1
MEKSGLCLGHVGKLIYNMGLGCPLRCCRHQRNKKNCSSHCRHHSQACHQKSSSGHGPTSHHWVRDVAG